MAARTWIRYLSALLIVATVVGIVVVTVDRARRVSKRVAGMDASEVVSKALSVYQGFEYKESIDGELIFILSSVRTLGMSSGWHEIEGVRLQFFDDGKPGPVLSCEKASFNTQTHDARLADGVHVEFPDGAFLSTEEGHFDSAARRFETDANVVFVGEAVTGNAGRAVYHLAADRLDLSEGVLIRDDLGGFLQAATVTYNRALKQVVFPDGCTITYADSRIVGNRAYLLLETEDSGPRQLELSGGVEFRTVGDLRAGTIEGWAERMRATRDPGGNWQVEATTTGPWVSLSFFGGESFIRRTIDTQVIRAVVGPRGMLNMRATERVCLTDLPLEGGMRRAEGVEAKMWFENGQPRDVELDRDVVLHGDGMEVRGYRARFVTETDAVLLYGNPTGPERVHLSSARGEVQSDQVHVFQARGVTEARGNVQGQLHDVPLLGGRGGERENVEPAQPSLHFAGGFLEVSQGGAVFELRDNARAWQGHQLLLADQLRYDEEGERLHAVGHVRTTIAAKMMDANADPDADVVVVARSLDYGRLARQAVYSGNVRYSDPRSILSCAELRVVFNDRDQVQEIEATGSVEIEDILSGQRVSGNEAHRKAESSVITLTGSPAQAMDAKGNVVRGRSLTWDQASGSVTVSGDTETIYVPEEAP